MGDDIRTAATNILCHAEAGVVDLVLTRFAAQLLDDLDDLVNPGRPNRVAARFQPSLGSNGDLALWANVSFIS